MEPILFDSPELLDNNLNFVIKRRLGRNVFVSRRIQIEKNNFNYIIGANCPKIIDDSKTGERVVKFLRFDSVGLLEVKKDMQIDKFSLTLPDVAEIGNKIKSKLSNLTFNVEFSLLETTHDKLVEIPLVQTFLNPIREIIVSIHETGSLNYSDFAKERGVQKADKYILFLESLDLIRRSEGNFVAGNKFVELEKLLEKKDSKLLYNKILAHTIRNGYAYIKEYLRLTSIVPFIRWSTSYFLPSIEADKLLFLNKTAIINYYQELYNLYYATLTKMSNQLDQVVNVGILHKEDKFIFGDKKIFDKLIDIPMKI